MTRGKFYLTQQELQSIKNIKHSEFKIKFQSQKLKYKKPAYTTEECILKGKTYSVSLYIPIEIKYKDQLIIN
jgi:DNA-directed RNA polymerase beta subunit